LGKKSLKQFEEQGQICSRGERKRPSGGELVKKEGRMRVNIYSLASGRVKKSFESADSQRAEGHFEGCAITFRRCNHDWREFRSKIIYYSETGGHVLTPFFDTCQGWRQ
jgi:hypothetical protein